MRIRAFRRLTREQRREIIRAMEDPLCRRILEVAFLGPGKVSWVKVALVIGGGNTANTVCQIAHRALAEVDKPVTNAPDNRATITTDGPATPMEQAYHGRATNPR